MSRETALRFIEISSSTKDSLQVTWTVRKDHPTTVSGYRIGFQALGSLVVQFTERLRPLVNHYDITNLHENTVYNVCVEVISNSSSSTSVPAKDIGGKNKDLLRGHWGTSLCVTGTTNSDQLSVALGSTVGAFVALALIVCLVLFAKWQHSHRKRKSQFLERRFVASGEYSFDEEVQRRTSYDDDDDDEHEPQLTATGSGLLYTDRVGELRSASGSGSPAILVYVDDPAAQSRLEGASNGSGSRLMLDSFDPSSFYVTGLGDGQGYGLLVPLSRASELLPLVVEDTVGPDGVQLVTARDQLPGGRLGRIKLQKHQTVDYGIHWDPELGPESGTFLLSHPEDPGVDSAEPWIKTPVGFLRSDEWGVDLLRRQSGVEPISTCSREGGVEGETPRAVIVSMAPQWQLNNGFRPRWIRTRSLSV